MNGAINVVSREGEGTHFCIYFPMIEEESFEKEESKTFINGVGHLLIAEDESAIVALYKRFFSKMGYEVSAFENGKLAYDFFKENHEEIDIVLTDMSMPKMNGVELTDAVKAIDPTIPVILCSGFSDDTKKGHRVDKFVYKPVDLKKLTKEIYNLIRK